MPTYKINCNKCDHTEEWVISVAQYTKKIKGKCPKCNEKKLYQDMSGGTPVHFIGPGWTVRNGGGFKGRGGYKTGSKEDMEDAEKEHDYLEDTAAKDDKWRKGRDMVDEARYKTGQM